MPAPKLTTLFIVKICALLVFFVQSFTAIGQQYAYTIGGNGTNLNSYNLNGGPSHCTGIPYPQGVCMDGGFIYFTVSNCVRKIDVANWTIFTVAGSDTYGHAGDGSSALGAELKSPYDVCMDNNHNLYITEWGGHYIRKINTVNGIISTVAGNGTGGFSGDGGPASSASVNRPQGICCDAAGNIYFADTYNSRIRKIDVATGIITTIAGTGATSYSGDGGPAANAGVPYPVDVSIDGAGDIYFIEVFSGNTSRVRKINATTGIISTVAGNGSYSYSGDGGPATNAGLFDPSGIFVDAAGNIYLSQYDDSRIRKVDVNTGIINTIAGTGVAGFGGDADLALNATIHNPMGLCVAANGDIYFADNANHRIRTISTVMKAPPSITATVSIAASTTAICTGTPVTFTRTLTGNAGNEAVTVNWQVNGVTVSTTPMDFTSSTLNNGDIVTCRVIISSCNNKYFITSNAITIVYGGPSTPPGISIRSDDTTICNNQLVNFTATPQNAGTNPVYQWKVNGTNTGTNSPSFSSSLLIDGDKVSCVITSDPLSTCGSTLNASSDTITIIVSAGPGPAVSIMPSTDGICPGTAISFTATTQNAGNSPSYQWKVNGSPVGSNSPVFTYNNFQNNDQVICQVSSSAGGCSGNPVSSAVSIVTVKTVPVISLNPADTIVAPGSQVQLRVDVSGPIASFQWTPSISLTDPASMNPLTVALTDDTKFTLLIISDGGCTLTKESNIKIFTKLYMPSAFTPNGDGLNDVYRIPPGVQLRLKNFSIYDRWGTRIFNTTDINKGWDGTISGMKKDPGVYVFIVSGADDKGAVFLKGTFVLVR